MDPIAANPEVVCTELEDGAVLLNMQTRLYYSLNEIGLELWNLVDVARTPEQIASKLAGSFEIEEEAAREVASRFVDELEREKLVVGSSGPPSPADPSSESPPRGEGGSRRKFVEPELIKHDEPLHEVPTSPFDPQLPLAE